MKHPIAFYGDPVLRTRCEEVSEITPEIVQFASDLIETMKESNKGIGIAAPQVGKPIRIFVTALFEYDENDEPVYEEPTVFINPVFSNPSEKTVFLTEGCLSIPGFHEDVERPSEIDVEYTDLDGNRQKERLSGWHARVAMHENDHLNGVLFIDRLPKRVRKKLEAQLKGRF